MSNLGKCWNCPIKECPTLFIYLIEFHLSKEKRAVTSLAVKLHKDTCQLRVKPPCYKKMKQTENVFLMLMMNNERVVQLMTNLDSHGKVINSVSHCHCSQNGWKQEKSHVNSFFSNDWTNFLSSKNVHLKCVCIHVALRNTNNRCSFCKVLLASNWTISQTTAEITAA